MIRDQTTVKLFEILENFNKNLCHNEIEELSPVQMTWLVNAITELYGRSTYLSKVREFHDTFKQFSHDTPVITPAIQLRLSLLMEELSELAEAWGTEGLAVWESLLAEHRRRLLTKDPIKEADLVAVFDAFIDIQYVLSGAIIASGMASKFDEGFDEVHSSNMSKTCATPEITRATVAHFENSGTPVYVEDVNELESIVYRLEDRKVCKSIAYRPADLGKILNLKADEDGVYRVQQ